RGLSLVHLGYAVTLPASRIPCVRFICFVRGFCSSSTHTTRGTGRWLNFTRWGLSPHKKRQASLSALTLGDENPLCLWIRPVAVGVPALHRNLAEAHGFQHHDKLVSVVPPQPMRPQLCMHQAPLFEDLMTHPDVLHLLDAVGHRGFVDEDGGPIRGAHP